jgi:hypothetical protein
MVSMESRNGRAQSIVAIIAIIGIAVAAAIIFRRLKKQSDEAEGDAYYYCEDCGYEFTASSKLVPPIRCPKTGTLTAVRAYKFKGLDCKVFTGYYQKYDPETKRLIEAARRGEEVDKTRIKEILVRSPDANEWVDSTSSDGVAILNSVRSPTDDSSGNDLQRVDPKSRRTTLQRRSQERSGLRGDIRVVVCRSAVLTEKCPRHWRGWDDEHPDGLL